MRVRALGRHVEEAEKAGVKWSIERCHALVRAIDGQPVLYQVIGSNAKEGDVAGKLLRHGGSHRYLDHDADLGLTTHLTPNLGEHRSCLLDLVEVGDHGEHDGKTSCERS